jgi:hypothetical protein
MTTVLLESIHYLTNLLMVKFRSKKITRKFTSMAS